MESSREHAEYWLLSVGLWGMQRGLIPASPVSPWGQLAAQTRSAQSSREHQREGDYVLRKAGAGGECLCGLDLS